jgi:hypothetical protein
MMFDAEMPEKNRQPRIEPGLAEKSLLFMGLKLVLVLLQLSPDRVHATVHRLLIGSCSFFGDKGLLRHLDRYFRKFVLFEIILLMVKNDMNADDPAEKFIERLCRVARILFYIMMIIRMSQGNLNIEGFFYICFGHRKPPFKD